MKVGFICINLPGHLNPMTALARQLQARNHEVVVACRRKIRANVNLMS
jgi:UDP:flavonoid glycosyltransferase YjiC (YdhE family)